MSENTIKNSTTKETKKGDSIFHKFDRAIDLERLFDEGIPYKYLPKVLFTCCQIRPAISSM